MMRTETREQQPHWVAPSRQPKVGLHTDEGVQALLTAKLAGLSITVEIYLAVRCSFLQRGQVGVRLLLWLTSGRATFSSGLLSVGRHWILPSMVVRLILERSTSYHHVV
jgi:hypothetical protein